MADSLLPTPASVNSQECDCKWVRRAMGGSVIRLDIPRDTVSIDCNIKSAGGHTRPPNNPPNHEEVPHSLGRAPTVIDLGPHSPGSCSPSLVPYETEEDSNPEKDQDQQRMTPKQMETKEPTIMEAPAKKGMGIAVGPGDYQPTPPKYVRADKDSMDG